jgi:hypothetical protein
MGVDGVIPQDLAEIEREESSRTPVLISKVPHPNLREGVGCEGLYVLCRAESSNSSGEMQRNYENR